MSIVWSISIVAFSVWVAAAILPGIRVKGGFWDIIVIAIIFSIANFLFGWFLFTVLGIATLGLGFLFSFLARLIVSALMLKLTDALTDRLKINSFGWAFGGAVVIAVLSAILEKVLSRIPGLPGI